MPGPGPACGTVRYGTAAQGLAGSSQPTSPTAASRQAAKQAGAKQEAAGVHARLVSMLQPGSQPASPLSCRHASQRHVTLPAGPPTHRGRLVQVHHQRVANEGDGDAEPPLHAAAVLAHLRAGAWAAGAGSAAVGWSGAQAAATLHTAHCMVASDGRGCQHSTEIRSLSTTST